MDETAGEEGWDGSHWYTLVGDGQGSTTLALKGDGTVQAVRYTDGTMPTPRNYTGQLLDDASGLLYYNARYYDPMGGSFTQTDTIETNADGQNLYGYVGENPETWIDPIGHLYMLVGEGGGGGGDYMGEPGPGEGGGIGWDGGPPEEDTSNENSSSEIFSGPSEEEIFQEEVEKIKARDAKEAKIQSNASYN